MKNTVAALLCLCTAPVAYADQADDLEKIGEMLRKQAVEAGDAVSLANYALKDFSAAQGYVDGCVRSDSEQEIRAMSDRFAEWSQPGLWAWLSGKRSEASDNAFVFANLSYSTARATALHEGCPNMAVSVKRLAADTHKQIFDGYLALQP